MIQKLHIIFTILILFFYSTEILAKDTVLFKGNKAFDSDDLFDIIEDNWEEYRKTNDISHIDDGAYLLQKEYRKSGYCFVEVDYENFGETKGERKVVFTIREHHKVKRGKIEIKNLLQGKTLKYKWERLKKFLTPPPLLGEHYFKKKEMIGDLGGIKDFYLSQGYLDVKTKAKFKYDVPIPNTKEVGAIFYITEGPRSYLDKIEYKGNLKFGEKKVLDQILNFKQGNFYKPNLEDELIWKIKNYYRINGYAHIKIHKSKKFVLQKNRKSWTVFLKISEGSKIYIRNIKIKDKEKLYTRQFLILDQLEIKPGDLYNSEKIGKSQRNLQETNLFLQVEIREKKIPGDEEHVDLIIHLSEREDKTITFSLGYSTTYSVTGGVKFEWINLFGTGRRLIIDVEGALKKSDASLRIIDPWFFGKRYLSGEIEFFGLYEETPSYDALDRGMDITILWRLSPSLSLRLGYRIEWSQVLDVEDGFSEVEEGTTLISSPTQKIILNLKNDRVYPTAGSYNYIEFEESLEALGAEVNYFKFIAHTAWYFRIYRRMVLAVGFEGGVIVPFGGSDAIPIQKRYFGGGATSIRSFKDKEMPPFNSEGNPIGGEGLFYSSAEFRIPVGDIMYIFGLGKLSKIF